MFWNVTTFKFRKSFEIDGKKFTELRGGLGGFTTPEQKAALERCNKAPRCRAKVNTSKEVFSMGKTLTERDRRLNRLAAEMRETMDLVDKVVADKRYVVDQHSRVAALLMKYSDDVELNTENIKYKYNKKSIIFFTV